MLRQKEIEKTELATYSVKVAETCCCFFFLLWQRGVIRMELEKLM